MFRFEHSVFLNALALLPVLALLFWWARRSRQRALRRLGQAELISRLMPHRSQYKHFVKFVLVALALALLIVGWANPQWGSKQEKVTRRSVDVFIALDISQSMLAEDIVPSRLERAQRFAQSLVEKLRGNRLGFIIFAGNAYLQVPLTTDYAAVELFIKSANTEQAPTQGTAIADVVDLAERTFDEDSRNHRALIIISDGENHDNEAVERARAAGQNNLLIYTVGVGTPEGSFIPIEFAGRRDYKRDNTGNPVLSKLNESLMKEIAAAGDGAYFNLNSPTEAILTVLENQIDKIEKREFEQRTYEEYESYFQYFIGIGILFLILEFLLSYRKSAYLEGRDIF